MNNGTRLFAAWIVSLVATAGSLYFSEIAGFIPCTLCWYQRILMYPLPILLGIAFYKNDTSFAIYGMSLASIGLLFSLYHYSLQKVPMMKALESCNVGVPCSGDYINWLGFITIPFLAGSAFLLILLFLFPLRPKKGA